LLRAKYDVILVPSPPLTAGLAAAVLARLTGRSLVYNVQEIYPDVAIELGVLRNSVAVMASRWLERFVYRRSDVIVTISTRFRDRLLAKGVPQEKVRVISNFAPDAPVGVQPPRKNAFSRAYGLDEKFVVLYAGNLGLTQDFDMVLAAAAELEGKTPIRFLIAGDGARRTWLEARLAAGGRRNVLLVPYQASSVVAEMYASSDVGLIPLRAGASATTFPSKIYTILANARPVVAAVESDSDVADLIRMAACGWIVAPGSASGLSRALMLAYEDPATTIAMGEAGKRYLQLHHTPALVARQYAETFAHLLPDGRRRTTQGSPPS
jgi:colanic acid biosynthesis glycosyl transferase WcaI